MDCISKTSGVAPPSAISTSTTIDIAADATESIHSPRVPYEICWVILEELLGAYSMSMQRTNSGKSIMLTNFEMIDEFTETGMVYLRISKTFTSMLRSIFSKTKLIYTDKMRRQQYWLHPLGRQLLCAGRSFVSHLQEVLIHHRSCDRVNSGICGGLGLLMLDRGLDVLVARIEDADHSPVGLLVIRPKFWSRRDPRILRQLLHRSPITTGMPHWISLITDHNGAHIQRNAIICGEMRYIRWSPVIQSSHCRRGIEISNGVEEPKTFHLNAYLQPEEFEARLNAQLNQKFKEMSQLANP